MPWDGYTRKKHKVYTAQRRRQYRAEVKTRGTRSHVIYRLAYDHAELLWNARQYREGGGEKNRRTAQDLLRAARLVKAAMLLTERAADRWMMT